MLIPAAAPHAALEQEMNMAAGNGGGGGLIGSYVIAPVVGLVKAYGLLVLVVLLVAGGASAAAVATTVATAIGTTVGIVTQEVGPFAKSITTGKGLVSGGSSDAKSDATPAPKKKN